MKYLIDADIYAYRAARLAEQEIQWGEDDWTLSMNMKEAMTRLRSTLANDLLIIGGSLADAIMVFSCSDPKRTWRHWENPAYKSNRKDIRKPTGYTALVQAVKADFEYDQRLGLEADDVLGIRGVSEDAVIVSVDKDMKTLPATVFNPDKDLVPRTYSEAEADHALRIQALTGDATDGYPGCRGIGPVKAAKILGDLNGTDAWNVVGAEFLTAADKELGEDALERDIEALALSNYRLNARMARICRPSDWNQERQEMSWEPPFPF